MVSDFNKARDSAVSIFEILDSKPKRDASKDEGTTLATVKGDIEFQHVSFKYPMRPNVPIFKDFCLTIPSGKVIIQQHSVILLTYFSSVKLNQAFIYLRLLLLLEKVEAENRQSLV